MLSLVVTSALPPTPGLKQLLLSVHLAAKAEEVVMATKAMIKMLLIRKVQAFMDTSSLFASLPYGKFAIVDQDALQELLISKARTGLPVTAIIDAIAVT